MAGQRPRFEVADIVRTHRDDLRRAHPLSAAQQRVLSNIAACRTAALVDMSSERGKLRGARLDRGERELHFLLELNRHLDAQCRPPVSPGAITLDSEARAKLKFLLVNPSSLR